ncbi:37S ribosomal protein, mitochondrial [Actinomortierella wolfii]|nr:37S ribosomal protein, mitochondrial [Actinomortierella wolfii]
MLRNTFSAATKALRGARYIPQQQAWIGATQRLSMHTSGAMYKDDKNKGAPAAGDDDLLDALMVGLEDSYTTPAGESKKASSAPGTVPEVPAQADVSAEVAAAVEDMVGEAAAAVAEKRQKKKQQKQATSTSSAAQGSKDAESEAQQKQPVPVDIQKRLKAMMPEFMATGAKLVPPPTTVTNPASNTLTISQLLAAGLHLGHSTSLWNSASMPFIYGIREGISIINLEHTLTHLRRACTVTKAVARQGGIILFVGTRDGMEYVTIDAALSCGAYHVSSKWTPGTITNAQEIVGPHTPRLPEARAGDLPKPFRPDLMIVLNPLENQIAIKEATKFHIPTIGITDTDIDPRVVSYPIPANDDSVRGVELIAKVLAEAAKEGHQLAVEASQERTRQRIGARADRMKNWSAAHA